MEHYAREAEEDSVAKTMEEEPTEKVEVADVVMDVIVPEVAEATAFVTETAVAPMEEAAAAVLTHDAHELLNFDAPAPPAMTTTMSEVGPVSPKLLRRFRMRTPPQQNPQPLVTVPRPLPPPVVAMAPIKAAVPSPPAMNGPRMPPALPIPHPIRAAFSGPIYWAPRLPTSSTAPRWMAPTGRASVTAAVQIPTPAVPIVKEVAQVGTVRRLRRRAEVPPPAAAVLTSGESRIRPRSDEAEVEPLSKVTPKP